MLRAGGDDKGRFLGDVEKLPERDVAAHCGVLGPGAAPCCGIHHLLETLLEQVIAPCDEQIAEQECRRAPECAAITRPAVGAVQRLQGAVARGLAAAGIGIVDDVIVCERRGLEDLERCRDGDDGRLIRRIRGDVVGRRIARRRVVLGVDDRTPAPVAERGAKALSAPQRPGCGVDQEGGILAHREGRESLRGEERVKSL